MINAKGRSRTKGVTAAAELIKDGAVALDCGDGFVMEHREKIAETVGGGESLEESRLAWHGLSLGYNPKPAWGLLGVMIETARLRHTLGRGRPDKVLIRLTM
jgi:hypothetical protein